MQNNLNILEAIVTMNSGWNDSPVTTEVFEWTGSDYKAWVRMIMTAEFLQL